MTPAPARWQRVAAALQPTLVQGRGPKGVRHATSQKALSSVSAAPPKAWDNLLEAALLKEKTAGLMDGRDAKGRRMEETPRRIDTGLTIGRR